MQEECKLHPLVQAYALSGREINTATLRPVLQGAVFLATEGDCQNPLQNEDRDRISFATSLNAGIKEKLKSYSFEKGVPMADIINALIENFIEDVEDEEGEIEVYKTFKVEDS